MSHEKGTQPTNLQVGIRPEIRQDFSSEIRMLRNAISRLYQQSQELDDVDEQSRILGALGLAINRLCNLIKAQGGNDGWQDEKAHRAAEALAQALDEVAREWKAGA